MIERGKMSSTKIEEVLRKYTDDLMTIPGVAGVGQGLCNCNPCIKVFAIKKTPELENKIPQKLEGYQIIIEETGEIHARPKNLD